MIQALKIKKTLSKFKNVNIWKTLYFNFKVLPFSQAFRLPFFLYGKVVLMDLGGKIITPNTVKMGMIRIGYRWLDLWPVSFLPTQIQVKGELIFHGPAILSGGTVLNVQNKNGIIEIGSEVCIGGGTMVKCMDRITIGDRSRITGNCCIMDCNMHFIKDIESGRIAKFKSPIIIGKNCWINYGTVISKGAVVPDYTITSRNTLVSKDFSDIGTNRMLVGTPAKVVGSKVQRIFSIELQHKFARFFNENNEDFYQSEPGIENEIGPKEGFN